MKMRKAPSQLLNVLFALLLDILRFLFVKVRPGIELHLKIGIRVSPRAVRRFMLHEPRTLDQLGSQRRMALVWNQVLLQGSVVELKIFPKALPTDQNQTCNI
jgi:hypothetical protein